jgi:hypothetical protein
MADTPIWNGPVPVLFTGAYQKRNFEAGIPGNEKTVFDALADPPASGVAAVEAD